MFTLSVLVTFTVNFGYVTDSIGSLTYTYLFRKCVPELRLLPLYSSVDSFEFFVVGLLIFFLLHSNHRIFGSLVP